MLSWLQPAGLHALSEPAIGRASSAMCGVAGYIGPRIDGLAERMIASLRHRGPDGEGVLVRDGLVLCHTRLAIVDLSEHGAQPMERLDGRIAVSFNGEIYNYEELRSEIACKGYRFAGHSDTELFSEGAGSRCRGARVKRSLISTAESTWPAFLPVSRVSIGINVVGGPEPGDLNFADPEYGLLLNEAGMGRCPLSRGRAANTILGISVIYGFVALGLRPVYANLLGYALTFPSSYASHMLLSFKYRGRPVGPFFRYLISAVVAYLVNVVVLLQVTYLFNPNGYLAQLPAMAAYVITFFILNRFFVFPVGERSGGHGHHAMGRFAGPADQSAAPPASSGPQAVHIRPDDRGAAEAKDH
jgi:putative flippase GtrA